MHTNITIASSEINTKSETEHSSFNALVFACSGGAGPSASRVMKQLATKFSEKRGEPYGDTISYIRTKISFALLRSCVLCLSLVFSVRLRLAPSWRREGCIECMAAFLCSFLDILFLMLPYQFLMCAIYIYWCFPLHLLVIFVTGPSLHSPEGNSLECSIRLSATHHPLCSDLHPSLPDGVHGPFYIY